MKKIASRAIFLVGICLLYFYCAGPKIDNGIMIKNFCDNDLVVEKGMNAFLGSRPDTIGQVREVIESSGHTVAIVVFTKEYNYTQFSTINKHYDQHYPEKVFRIVPEIEFPPVKAKPYSMIVLINSCKD